MKSEKFTVEGMSCSACSSAVERAVGKLKGVENASVSLMQNLLVCEYDSLVTDRRAIIQAVKNAGFSAFPYNPDYTAKENDDKDKTEKAEQRKVFIRLVLSALLLVVLMYISMGSMAGMPLPKLINPHYNPFLFGLSQLIVTIPVVILNRKFFVSGTRAFISKAPNMDSLVSVGSAAALIYGVYNLVMALVYKDMAHELVMNLYFESAATILTLVTVGKYLESRSKSKAGQALKGLLKLAPKSAVILKDGKETEINASDIAVGDIVVIKPGGMIPTDGVVFKGQSSVDEKALTGESIPAHKTEGDSVMSASVNIEGSLLVRATKVGGETTLAKIISLVSNASASKAPIARLADKISGVFVPVVMVISVVTFLVWLVCGYAFDFALSRAISVLVISCPCALGLATPVAITVASGKCASEGILVKSAKTLEVLSGIDTVVFDKTGTITKGRPSVTDIIPHGVEEKELIKLAFALESSSEHPLSRAVCIFAREKYEENDFDIRIENFKAVFGKGVCGSIDGQTVLGGNMALMEENGVDTTDVKAEYENISSQGKTPLIFAENKKVVGIIAVADTLKDNSEREIEKIKKLGIDTYLLTGDNALCAVAVGKSAGIKKENIFSGVLPQDKEEKIRLLQSGGKKVLMVGDGINDSPAMVRADIGMAMGSGADIAASASDIVLMKSDIADVYTALVFGRKTVKNIKQNLFWAFFYNTLGIPVAAGVLYSAYGLVLSPVIAAAAMSFSSLFVVLNALTLFKMKSE